MSKTRFKCVKDWSGVEPHTFEGHVCDLRHVFFRNGETHLALATNMGCGFESPAIFWEEMPKEEKRYRILHRTAGKQRQSVIFDDEDEARGYLRKWKADAEEKGEKLYGRVVEVKEASK